MAARSPSPTPPDELFDALLDFAQGVNAGIAPQLLPKNQLADALNCTVRGDFLTDRPPFRQLSVPGGSWQTGRFQDAIYYQPDAGPEAIVAAIGGEFYKFIPGPVPDVTNPIADGAATVAHVTTYGTLAAFFTVSALSGTEPLTVQFTDASSGTISAYDWDFGDGSAHSSQQSPAHTYAKGSFTALLTITDPGGATATFQQTLNIASAVSLPVASFTADTVSIIAGDTVTFTNASTGTITGHKWWFGDAASPPSGATDSTSASPTHTYSAAGTYTVTLEEHDGSGHTSTYTMTITVAATAAPVAAFSVVSLQKVATVVPDGGDTGEWIVFPSSSVATVGVDSVAELQDLPVLYVPAIMNRLSPSNVLFSWTPNDLADNIVTGLYDIGVFPDDLEIYPGSPVQKFSAFSGPGYVPLTVQLTNKSAGAISSHAWWFGDGHTTSQSADSTTASPTHTYATPGTYTITLKETGTGGNNTKTLQIVVLPLPPVAAFTSSPSPATINAGQSVSFTDTSTGSPDSVSIDFGDGTNSGPKTPGSTVSHTYATAANRVAILTATNAGGSTTAQLSITVSTPPPPPVANFTYTPASGPVGLSVVFTDTSTGPPTSWAWDFGDGNTSTSQSPTHVYASGGTYTVTLAVANTSGTGRSTISNAVTIIPVPVAGFAMYSPPNGYNTFYMTDASAGIVTSRLWNFGDGVTATTLNTGHYYGQSQVGPFTVTLTVTGPGGSSSFSLTGGFSNYAGSLQFGYVITSGRTANFVIANTIPVQINTVDWNFGDGSAHSTAQNPSHTYATAGTRTVTCVVNGNTTFSASVTVT